MKGEVAQKDNTCKIKELKKRLSEDTLSHITTEERIKCVRHTEQLQEEDFM